MLNFDSQQEIRSTLDLARRDINRQKPNLALERLRRIGRQIDDADPFERAHYSLLLGEAFAAKRDQAAETYLLEAEERIKAIPVRDLSLEIQTLVRDLELELRVYEQLGKFYTFVVKNPNKAKDYFYRAKSEALGLNRPEVAAENELMIIAINLKISNDPDLEYFQMLRRVAGEDYLAKDQLSAWYMYLENKSASQPSTLLYARKADVWDEQYFRNLLKSAKESR